jgi:hypothetical protein
MRWRTRGALTGLTWVASPPSRHGRERTTLHMKAAQQHGMAEGSM